jgi:voltage-dependent potassium channel beta subunit
MRYRYLGNSGLQVSELSYGAWVTFADQIGEEKAEACMHAAFAAGVNFFDNAEVYAEGRAETLMGNILKRSGWPRSSYVVSTKIFWGGSRINERGLSRKHIREGTEAALQRLQVDYVDLIFCHRPDLQTPISETVRAMNWLIERGYALYWGTSEWNAGQIMEAQRVADHLGLIGPLMEQPEYNMFHRQRVEVEYVPVYKRIGLGLTTWSPLASGLLTGKYNAGTPEGSRATLAKYSWLQDRLIGESVLERIGKVAELQKLAADIKMTMPQLALAWCLNNSHVSTVITGASGPEQVEENMQASELRDRLTPTVMSKIEKILANQPAAERDWKG